MKPTLFLYNIEGYSFKEDIIPNDFKVEIPNSESNKSLKEMLDNFIHQISEIKYPVSLDEELLGEKVISVSPSVYKSIENEIIYGRYKGYLIDYNRFQPDNYIFSN